MNNKILVELLLIVTLISLGFTTLNPYWMPMGLFLGVISALIVLFGIFAVFVWREKGGDEREVTLLHKSDRAAFLAGATVLLFAIVYESVVMHKESPWVITALLVMVVVKLLSYLYHERS